MIPSIRSAFAILVESFVSKALSTYCWANKTAFSKLFSWYKESKLFFAQIVSVKTFEDENEVLDETAYCGYKHFKIKMKNNRSIFFDHDFIDEIVKLSPGQIYQFIFKHQI